MKQGGGGSACTSIVRHDGLHKNVFISQMLRFEICKTHGGHVSRECTRSIAHATSLNRVSTGKGWKTARFLVYWSTSSLLLSLKKKKCSNTESPIFPYSSIIPFSSLYFPFFYFLYFISVRSWISCNGEIDETILSFVVKFRCIKCLITDAIINRVEWACFEKLRCFKKERCFSYSSCNH